MRISTAGLRYVGLYNFYRDQVVQILRNNPTIRTHAGNTINSFMPGVRKYLFNDVNGYDFVLTSTRIANLQALVNEIKATATPGLQSDLDQFMGVIRQQQDQPVTTAVKNILAPSP
jgi:hypothetical protein